MTEETTPYLPPSMLGVAPGTTPPSLPPPPAVKVFGILHLVLAGFGVISTVLGLLSPLLVRAAGGTAPKDPSLVIQMRYMEKLWPATVMNTVATLGIALLLAVAGLKLVRARPEGVSWSNRYAWTSIIWKLIYLVITLVWILPMTQEMMGSMLAAGPALPPGSPFNFGKWMEKLMAIISVAAPLISCVYPALALYFLSRVPVRAWVERERAS